MPAQARVSIDQVKAVVAEALELLRAVVGPENGGKACRTDATAVW